MKSAERRAKQRSRYGSRSAFAAADTENRKGGDIPTTTYMDRKQNAIANNIELGREELRETIAPSSSHNNEMLIRDREIEEPKEVVCHGRCKNRGGVALTILAMLVLAIGALAALPPSPEIATNNGLGPGAPPCTRRTSVPRV